MIDGMFHYDHALGSSGNRQVNRKPVRIQPAKTGVPVHVGNVGVSNGSNPAGEENKLPAQNTRKRAWAIRSMPKAH